MSARIHNFSATAAVLYRLIDPGAYGPVAHSMGWHLETGFFFAEPLEVAVQVAHVLPDLEATDRWELETAVAINGFPDSGRMRVQLEYAYLMVYEADALEHDSHRVVVQLQARY